MLFPPSCLQLKEEFSANRISAGSTESMEAYHSLCSGVKQTSKMLNTWQKLRLQRWLVFVGHVMLVKIWDKGQKEWSDYDQWRPQDIASSECPSIAHLVLPQISIFLYPTSKSDVALTFSNSITILSRVEKNIQCESFELSFIGGKMWTVA